MSNAFVSGFEFGMGLAVAACVAILIASLVTKNAKDDSDPPDGRSGVAVVTDHKTGLQYLRSPGGGITPRLTSDGEHMRASQ